MNESANDAGGAPPLTTIGPRPPGPVFALVAGEDSGDQLGADLIEALRLRFPDARFVGVGGPRMRDAGMDCWHDIGELSVMGLAEVLRHLPRLLRLRSALVKRIAALKPDMFIGVDAPDFNLGLEKRLKRAGIRTVHYVSPSVWAWRERRAAKMGESADCVLCLFPMEPAIYARYGVNAQFVGHPLADRFPLVPDRGAARRELGLDQNATVLAVLPGSRLSEIHRLGAIFVDAAQRVAEAIPNLQIVIPAANAGCRAELEKLLQASGLGLRRQDAEANGEAGPEGEPQERRVSRDSGLEKAERASIAETSSALTTDSAALKTSSSKPSPSPESRVPGPVLLDGQAHRALVAADVVLLASGTAALEAMLAKRPMVVGYRIAPLTYGIVRGLGMLKTKVYSLPNILAGEGVVPELMQHDCTPEKLADEVLRLFRERARRAGMVNVFERLHLSLHAGGGAAAAAARVIGHLLAAPVPERPHAGTA